MTGKRMKKIISMKSEVSPTMKFRKSWLKKGIELINITKLCEPYMGNSGCCNDFNEPEECLHHIQIRYREETIANLGPDGVEIIDDDLHVAFDCGDNNFIIYRKVVCNG